MGFFDFLFGKDTRQKNYALVVRDYTSKLEQVQSEVEFKNKEINSLHLQNLNLTKQNTMLIETIQKFTTQVGERLEMLERIDVHIPKAQKRDEQVEETEPDSERAAKFFEKGRSLLRTRKYKQAIKEFESAIGLVEDYKEALLHLGICYHKLGEQQPALTHIEKAIELDKNYKDAWLNKGLVLDEMGSHKEAIKCFDKVIYMNTGK